MGELDKLIEMACKINNQTDNTIDTGCDIILYHGSRGGIKGKIRPISRERCDFGAGFYLGQHEMQAKGLVAEDSAPVFYKVCLHLPEIPQDKIWYLNGQEWLYTVLSHRENCKEFNQLQIAKELQEKAKKYDVIIGPIADDKMNAAIQAFSDGFLSDQGLIACLQHVGYGNQYVLKTPLACEKAEILEERPIRFYETDEIHKYNATMREKSRNIVHEVSQQYFGKGNLLKSIIQQEKSKEKGKVL